ncbi:hypothetical protein [Sphingomonas sp. SRS2]|uniref:hypothetical protein n=1 Tax=Sphingomonas sp. SRS2 TaxID=133190 RepID=UPI0006184E11|nr:hypothetical protein [Sphingomonas sp. SRS2]KKC27972.1 hypothetical protein WP12_00385 [Sphingomonas sp. SRS2]
MSYQQASETPFRYPVLSMDSSGYVSGFANLHNLTQLVPHAFKSGQYEGMELIDSNERRWIVRSGKKIGRATRWGLLDILLFNPPNLRVAYELEELPPLSLDEIKERAITSEREFSFGEYEADGETAQFDALLARIRAARNVAGIFKTLSLDEVQFI